MGVKTFQPLIVNYRRRHHNKFSFIRVQCDSIVRRKGVRERECKRERERDGDRGRRKGNILRGRKAMTMLKKSHNNKLKTR